MNTPKKIKNYLKNMKYQLSLVYSKEDVRAIMDIIQEHVNIFQNKIHPLLKKILSNVFVKQVILFKDETIYPDETDPTEFPSESSSESVE